MRHMFMNQAGGGDGGGTGSSGAAGAGSAGSTGATGSQDWTASLNDDHKAYVKTKGFTGVDAVLESYRNYEKAQGYPKERQLVLPESLEDAKGMDPVWQRLGKPKEAKEYTFDVPKDLGLDEKFAERIKEWGFKHNMTRPQLEGFVKEFLAHEVSDQAATKADVEAEVRNQQAKLKTEWGSAFEQNKNIATQAAKHLGLTDEQIQGFGAVMGVEAAAKMFHQLGMKFGEAKFITSDTQQSGVKSSAEARAEIDALKKDTDFQRRLMAQEADSVKKWNRLHEQAFSGMQ